MNIQDIALKVLAVAALCATLFIAAVSAPTSDAVTTAQQIDGFSTAAYRN